MFAKVIVDVANSAVDKTFDYLAPSDLLQGQRVLVPFGGRNIEGYVLQLSDTSDYPLQKIKPIIKALDKIAVITPEMFKLSDFMRQQYNLKMVDILRLFIPSQMRGGRVKELTRNFIMLNPLYKTEDTSEFIKSSAMAQKQLHTHLMNCEGEFSAQLSKNFSAAALKNFIDRGIVEVSLKQILRTPFTSAPTDYSNLSLTKAQNDAIKKITNKNGGFLLHGVTGSGKTEVYINCILNALQKGKSAIMLVPEISLTPQVFSRFKDRFKDNVAILHSGLSAGERFDEWTRLITGQAQIAVGARSAIFAPLSNLGIIIIDEEHDHSYTSESNPRYNTHQIAKFRAQINDCSLVFGSATPSIETYFRARNTEFKSTHDSKTNFFDNSKYHGVKDLQLINMPDRVNNSPMPEIKIVNMCNEVYSGNNSMFSAELFFKLKECFDKGMQAMLFINRRGYSSFLRCTACGLVAKCERCDVSLVYHKEDNILKCHYCGNRYNPPDICPKCSSVHLKKGYVGTQQVQEKLKELFPNIKSLRMDNDTTQTKDSHAKILNSFRQKEADVLIGTQMIAKGHDFPFVTVVGIMDADVSLHFSDYKSNERTFQLITQVAGRAGRADNKGYVVLQTYSPNHYVYKFATNYDYHSLYKKEINLREVTCYPPFSQIVRVLVLSQNQEKAALALKELYDEILKIQSQNKDCFAYLSYMYSPLKKIKDVYRMQILMRVTDCFDEILLKVYNVINNHKQNRVSVFVEINPSSLS